MSVDTALREKFRQKIAADYDEHLLRAADIVPPVKRLPTGSYALDYVCGGDGVLCGLPFGRLTRMWGGYSSCKSTAMLGAIRSAQNYGEIVSGRLEYLAANAPERVARKIREQAKRIADQAPLACLYIDTEGSFDPVYAERLGVRTDQKSLEVIQSEDHRGDRPDRLRGAACLPRDLRRLDDGHELGLTSFPSRRRQGRKKDHADGPEGPLRRVAGDDPGPASWAATCAGGRTRWGRTTCSSTPRRSAPRSAWARQKMEGEQPPGGKALEHKSS
jgi:hypothetical protein